MADRLYRSVDDRMLAGVAGGVAERLDADPSIIRVVWALLVVLTGGVALIAYLVMAVVVPDAPTAATPLVDASTTGTPDTPAGPNPAPTAPGGWIARDGQAVARADAPATGRTSRSRTGGDDDRGALIGGLILILLGGYFLARQFIPDIDVSRIWPLILVGIGVVLVAVSVAPGRRSG